MNNKIKNYTLIGLGILLILGGALLCIFLPKEEYSYSERRELEKFPTLTLQTLANGDFMKNFEEYATDNFPFRDAFRSLKARFCYSILRQKDNNGLYLQDEHIASMDYPYNPQSIEYAASRFEYIREKYLQNSKVFLSVIPDKSTLLAEQANALGYDLSQLISDLREKMPHAEYINILDTLSPEDYYYTDSHWRQESIIDTASRLAEGMNGSINTNFTVRTTSKPFYGVYYGQAAVGGKGDTIRYLTNPIIEGFKAYDHQNQKEIPIYDEKRLEGKDPYELFLSGPLSLITIENPSCENGRHLILFRDSFSSSLAPLLAQGYSKVTLADIRYIGIDYLSTLVDYKDADVLFLYSSSVLNNSNTLK